MLSFIEYLNVPAKIGFGLVLFLLVLQITGEIAEVFGKAVPEFMKIRKYFKRRKEEKQEIAKTLSEVKVLLTDVNAHYSADNITKRNEWMKWVNDRAVVYDASIGKVDKISEDLVNATQVLEELFVQNSRDRIIDFASKASDKNSIVSREEFNRIFKVHKKYEQFLKDHQLTNGEVDVAFKMIEESYEDHMKNHTFIEDVRGYGV